MKKNFLNESKIQGYVYEHKLELKTSGERSKNPGTQFISGTLSIATDEACLNVVPVHYTYVTATTATGRPNNTFNTLKKIIDTNPSVLEVGQAEAMRVRVDTSVDLNEWFQDPEKDEKPISVKRNEGGFIHAMAANEALLDNESLRATFKTDILLTGVVDVEADPERKTPDKVLLKGYIFNFRKDLLPVEFSVLNTDGMDYFRNLGASPRNPILTQVWGIQVSQTVTREIVTPSAFGEASVRIVTTSNKDYVVTGVMEEPYVWDDESTLTVVELKEMLAKREIDVATRKQNQIDYAKSRNQAVTDPAKGEFNF